MDVFDSLTELTASRLRASAFAPFVQPFWDRLSKQRYSPGTARQYMNCVAHFAHWSRRRQFVLQTLDQHIVAFVVEHLPRCTCAAPVQRSRHQLQAALRHLKAIVCAAGVQQDDRPDSCVDEQLRGFDHHLLHAKGLADSTRLRRTTIVRALLSMTSNSTTPSAEELRYFLAQELSRVSAASGAITATAVRSYLRFRAFEGDRIEHLLPVVAAPAHWRLAPLPQTLKPDEVNRLLAAFPADLPSRLRCYALVRCVVDLGLRSSEAIALELDDIDWIEGTVRISRSKSRRADVLPLPQLTGAAIADYVRSERPQTTSRRVFVRHVAPVDEPVAADVVRRAVRQAYRRAGLPHTRVHILRHTLASRLLNTGGTLKEVADVLRHRELDTSLIYAKVDFGRLGVVAMPWPGSRL
ncbi:MAG: integrase [Burkholderiales bacterium RIFCSPLOWO2_12_67_14]|jgi:integrase|nr:MAG: integrase [Burkholderiales bacterium RIFCSPLOWO2_02_FULL_67_64]OGB38963.1 MAG: integrase [Burkholderiales bacterium RIFCSPHIGHO2_12_FULL_67_38]OGB44416.1 MAG: integrase [Burkholderiales bacterium RIFCSPLOWO2_12_67_14]OGB83192.1 MAG: integrase [Burkholderiales bacterium RIFCSPLOWO2_12_FULL_67_210]